MRIGVLSKCVCYKSSDTLPRIIINDYCSAWSIALRNTIYSTRILAVHYVPQ